LIGSLGQRDISSHCLPQLYCICTAMAASDSFSPEVFIERIKVLRDKFAASKASLTEQQKREHLSLWETADKLDELVAKLTESQSISLDDISLYFKYAKELEAIITKLQKSHQK